MGEGCDCLAQAGEYKEKIHATERNVLALQEAMSSVTSRIDRLEPEIPHINKKLDEMQEEMGRRFDGLSKKLGSLVMQSMTAVCVVIVLLGVVGFKLVAAI